MSTLTTIAATDIISASRSVINANFATLNSEKVDIAGTYADPLWLTSISGAKVTGGISGNAATATRLATARTIAGVAFDGTANISIPYSGLTGAPALAAIATSGSASDLIAGTVPAARGGAGAVSGLLKADGAGLVSAAVAGTDFVVPAGNVATATRLATARTIAGVAFDGTANIAIASTGLSDSADIVRGGAALSTTGSVPFVTAAGVLGQSANLFWDNANGRLGVGTSSPAFDFQVSKANPSLSVRANTTTGQAQILIGNTTADWSIYTTGTSTPLRWFFGSDRMALTTSGNLLLGTTTDDGVNRLQVAGSGVFTGNLTVSNQGTSGYLRIFDSTPAASNPAKFLTVASGQLRFYNNAYSASLMALADNGNLLLGTTTDDGTNRLQVAGSVNSTGNIGLGANNATSQSIVLSIRPGNDGATSSGAAVTYSLGGNIYSQMQLFGTTGSSQFLHDLPSGGLTWRTYSGFNNLMSLSAAGSLTVRNETPTTGSTSLVVRAGAGQGTNLLQQWQNSSGSSRLQVTSTLGMQALGTFFSVLDSGGTISRAILQSTLDFNDSASVRWSSTGDASATKDLSLSRASANVLQVGDGGANASGSLVAGNITANSTLNIGSVGSPIRFWGGASNDLSLSRASAGVLQVGDGGANANGTVVAAKVGIGTSTPSTELQIVSTSTGTRGIILSQINTDAQAPTVTLRKSRGTPSSLSAVANADYAGFSNYEGYSGVTYISSASFGARVAGAVTNSSVPIELFWSTSGGANDPDPYTNGNIRLMIKPNGNTLLGTTTDGNFRLDVAASGSSGTARIYDQTPTTGSTSLVVRAGAGQSGNLQTWQSAAGTTLAFITDGGRASFSGSVSIGSSALDTGLLNSGTGLKLGSGSLIGWNNAASVSTSNPDLSLSRASANTLQVGDGSANSNGTIVARRVQSAGETVANLPAAAAGNAGTITYITDANATTIGSTVAGGGSNKVLVWSNGTAWKIFAS